MSCKRAAMKKANGMGSVYKLSGNRRKPWVACVTVSIEACGNATYKQKRKIIGFFESKEAAEFSLWKYNKNPILFEELQKKGAITFENVYQQWASTKFKNLSQNAINGYKAAFAKCESIWKLKIADLKTMHFQQIMDASELSLASDLKLKGLMVSVCEYAMQNDIINKNYAKYVMINRKEETEDIHKPFTESEIKKLFQYDHLPYVDTILIMIYTGFRVGELFEIKNSDIDFKHMTIIGGSKTEAGKNRMVPLHVKIQPYIMKYWDAKEEYLFRDQKTNKKIDYHHYRYKYFDPIMKRLGMDHLPHDCRHTFATRLSNANANATSIKKLIGHASYAMTEKIYTHKDIIQLRKAINSLE
ncbi:tyrosine-type recombinase/integrase [[Eubacterium] hominis]|uniref:tyrosine-type recombinase/integrase n=1 Tax=[Eubacterium] hominis TaxID=2764325 RepID=UPI003A4DEB50